MTTPRRFSIIAGPKARTTRKTPVTLTRNVGISSAVRPLSGSAGGWESRARIFSNDTGNVNVVASDPGAASNPFFNMGPGGTGIPLLVLATVATFIASQSVISGVFSMTRQAIQLGLLPRFSIRHTSESVAGQIYLPRINKLLLVGVLLVVTIFHSSSSLASAYGISVTATMVIDSAMAFFVIWKLWKWPLWRALWPCDLIADGWRTHA